MSRPQRASNVIEVDFRAPRPSAKSGAGARAKAPAKSPPAPAPEAPAATTAPEAATPGAKAPRTRAPRTKSSVPAAQPADTAPTPAAAPPAAPAAAAPDPAPAPSPSTPASTGAEATEARAARVHVDLDPADPDARSARKRAWFADALQAGIVGVVFDPRAEGVSVPAAFATRPELVLNFSWRFHIPDFRFDEHGIRATLSFDSGDHRCVVPWTAIWVLQSRPEASALVVPIDASAERKPSVPAYVRNLRATLATPPA